MSTAAAIVVAAGVVLVGFAAAWLAIGERHDRWVVALAMAPGVAYGSLSLGLFLSLSVGLSGVWGVVGAAALAATLAGVSRCATRGRPIETPASPDMPWLRRVAVLLVVASAVGLTTKWVQVRTRQPHGTPDAVYTWNKNARVLYRSGADARAVLRDMELGHPEYPLLIPGAVASQWIIGGGEHPVTGQLVSLGFLVGLTLLTYLAVSRLASPALALAAAAVLLSTPKVWKWAFSQCADVPLAYLVLAGVAGCLGAADDRAGARWPPLLTGFLVGLLPWTKDEGAVLMLVVICSCAAVHVAGRARSGAWPALGVPWLVLGVLPGLVAVVVHKVLWVRPRQIEDVLSGEPLARVLDPERWGAIATAMAGQANPLGGGGSWGLLWVAVVVLVVLRGRRALASAGAAVVSLTVVLALAGYVGIYLVTPQDLARILPTTLQRLLLQIYPLAVVWLFGVGLGSAAENEGGDQPRPYGRFHEDR
jgi:hypothetical protein